MNRRALCLPAAMLAAFAAPCAAAPCIGHGVEMQVLGSGGPELEDQRASSSYLIWSEGRPTVLVDSGGGSALRFGQSGAHVAQLDVILFTHFHIDHSADFPALIKSSYFESRDRPLSVYGPAGNASFPSATEFVGALFDGKRGAYRYLGNFTKGDGGYLLEAHTVPITGVQIRSYSPVPGLQVAATTVIHGGVPAVAWRVNVGGKRIVFSGDTNGDNGNLERLARDADIFVAHNAVPEGETGAARQLHMPPSVIGRIAAEASVRQLVLSHRMLRTLGHETETRAVIASRYPGPVSFADDLDCFR